jgi:hypothetical protein
VAEPSVATRSLPPRAAVALLTLQLRAAQQEARDAEAEAERADPTHVREQIRTRLATMIDERQAILDERLDRARRDAAAAIAAAHARSAAVAARAEPVARLRPAVLDDPPTVPDQPSSPAPTVASSVDDTVPAPAPTVAPTLDDALAPTVDDAVPPTVGDVPPAVPPEPRPAPAPAGAAAPPSPLDRAPDPTTRMPIVPVVPPPPPGSHGQVAPTVSVVIDADAFARAFAAALAPVLEARAQQAPPDYAYRTYAPPPQKRSFWAHAWHPDVLLSALAMIIVLVVLVAWSG